MEETKQGEFANERKNFMKRKYKCYNLLFEYSPIRRTTSKTWAVCCQSEEKKAAGHNPVEEEEDHWNIEQVEASFKCAPR